MPAFDPAPTGRFRAFADVAPKALRERKILRMVDKIAIVGLSLSLTLAGCTAQGVDGGDTTMPTTNATTSTGLVTSAPLETARASQTLPVYWLGRSSGDVYLYREFFRTESMDDPIATALRTMMDTKPKDPDYFSLWNSPSRLGASVSAKNVITVDVSADAFGQKVDQGIASRSIDQLVYTATAAAAMAGLVDTRTTIQVSVLVDGHTGYNAFGHVLLDKPLTRDAAFVAPVWIIDPANKSTYNEVPLKVMGQGISPTGILAWSLATVVDGTVEKQFSNGTVTIPKGANELGEFTFSLVPPTGTYQLSVYIADASMPDKKIGLDTKIVTISERSQK